VKLHMPTNNSIEQIDFLIKTIERYDRLRELLFSIAEFYKNAKIFIADDSRNINDGFYQNTFRELKNFGLKYKPRMFKLPYDKGLSYGRNYLVKQTKNPYVLLLDDDFVFNSHTKIENFLEIIQQNDRIGMVGGLVKDNDNKEIHFEFSWDFKNNILTKINDGNKWVFTNGIRYKFTESVLNFAILRREVFSKVLWDENIKICGEHEDFLLRLKKTNWKIAYTDSVIIRDLTSDVFTDYKNGLPESNYSKLRRRISYRKLFFKKHKIKKIINIDGSVETPENLKIKYYYKLKIKRLIYKFLNAKIFNTNG
jgi:hypothetical protein